MSRYLPVLFAAPFLIALTGCELENMAAAVNEKEDFHMNLVLKSGGHFRLENFNGSVEITGWEKEEVDVAGTKYASTQSQLAQIKIDVQSTPEGLNLRTIPPVERRGNSGAKYIIRVPRRLLLEVLLMAVPSPLAPRPFVPEYDGRGRTSRRRTTRFRERGPQPTRGQDRLVLWTAGSPASCSKRTRQQPWLVQRLAWKAPAPAPARSPARPQLRQL